MLFHWLALCLTFNEMKIHMEMVYNKLIEEVLKMQAKLGGVTGWPARFKYYF